MWGIFAFIYVFFIHRRQHVKGMPVSHYQWLPGEHWWASWTEKTWALLLSLLMLAHSACREQWLQTSVHLYLNMYVCITQMLSKNVLPDVLMGRESGVIEINKAWKALERRRRIYVRRERPKRNKIGHRWWNEKLKIAVETKKSALKIVLHENLRSM